MIFETPLLDLPTGVCTFYMDTTDPHTPAVAIASGSNVYIYKNFRPYFKFNLPSLELNSTECDLWAQVKEVRETKLVIILYFHVNAKVIATTDDDFFV